MLLPLFVCLGLYLIFIFILVLVHSSTHLYTHSHLTHSHNDFHVRRCCFRWVKIMIIRLKCNEANCLAKFESNEKAR